jgi:hypothetical protein
MGHLSKAVLTVKEVGTPIQARNGAPHPEIPAPIDVGDVPIVAVEAVIVDDERCGAGGERRTWGA